MAYGPKIIDHYENPHNVGSFGTQAEIKQRKDVGVGLVGAPECGDVMQLQIKVGKDGVIEDAKFKTFGCGMRSPVLRWPPNGSRAKRSRTPGRSRTP